MYALDPKQYVKWQLIPEPLRFWVKTWVDSLHSKTHPHWMLSPLSLIGLAGLWRLFSRSNRTGQQREAIVWMATARADDPGRTRPIPRTRFNPGEDEVWQNFFDEQLAAADTIRQNLLEWHSTELLETLDLATVHRYMRSLFGALSGAGVATDQLMRGILLPVIDSEGKQPGTPADRFLQWLSRYNPLPTEDYIAYTRLLSSTPQSNTALRSWSTANFATPAEAASSLRADTTAAVLVGPERIPYVVTRLRTCGMIGEYHRSAARKLLAAKQAEGTNRAACALHLPLKSHFQRNQPEASERYHDTDIGRFGFDFDTGVLGDAVAQFGNALMFLMDAPDLAIREIVLAAEQRWGNGRVDPTNTVLDSRIASAYQWSLRGDLKQEFDNHRGRLRSQVGAGLFTPIPEFLDSLLGNHKLDTSHLARLRQVAIGQDALMVSRIAELVEWYPRDAARAHIHGRAHTHAEARHLVTLARGVRNTVTHEGLDFSLPANRGLYPTLLFIGKFMFRAVHARATREAVWNRGAPDGVPRENA